MFVDGKNLYTFMGPLNYFFRRNFTIRGIPKNNPSIVIWHFPVEILSPPVS